MVTLKKMVNLPDFQMLKLVAGEKGMDRMITGVNVTESVDWVDFFRPNELIVTTGINMENNPEKVVEMVRSAYRRKAVGIVLNTGPYIPDIPEEVLHFAEKYQFPVFQMPWEYRVADFIKMTVQFLISEQHKQTKAEQLLSDLLFNHDIHEGTVAKELAQLGFKEDADFGIIVCTPSQRSNKSSSFVQIIEHAFTNRYENFLSIIYQDEMIYLVDRSKVRTPEVPFIKTVEHIQMMINKQEANVKLLVGMGNFYRNIFDIPKSYFEAKKVIHLARRHSAPFICKYKDIGAYKIIMAVKDRNMIEMFHQDMLGLLYRYDKLHKTDYVHFLRVFLEEDGQTTNISRREFIHRNTVLYKMKKIESILDVDLSHSYTKTNLLLAFMIEDILR
ncbi:MULTISPECIES: PucR family transcriptional regulator [Bacillus]|uniref:PucR family transcriptional regulator n=1 Tax=Bacillus TaxID=1386 RepID=UPI002E22E70B|nr:PucR family transcriptional regulator ligand-binding domain-containing protein [Bacillus smithii]MED1418928.1 PucR family transcriptional regulator ligand-binding domain-containing protein [Bacillus smithii]MED1455184.1 PucR family transcriptional regulator ligand-binding domain-containing protein [Bacillus smithii]